jgi:hypothetical protein
MVARSAASDVSGIGSDLKSNLWLDEMHRLFSKNRMYKRGYFQQKRFVRLSAMNDMVR